jgi:hypothetical protein
MDDLHTLKATAGRASARVVKTYTLDGEAVELLDVMVGHVRGHGMFLSRLVREEAVRLIERERLHRVVKTALAHGKDR